MILSQHRFAECLHRIFAALCSAFGATAVPARDAHPHVWVTMKSEIVYARGRHRDRHPPRLDLRRHVLDLRHAGSRQQGEGQVHPRGAGAARRGQRHLAEGIRLLHARAGERQEGRVDRRRSTISSNSRTGADAALHPAAEDAGESAKTSISKSTIRPISSTSRLPRRSRCALTGAPAACKLAVLRPGEMAPRRSRKPAQRGVLQQSRSRRAISARNSPTRSR